MRNAWRRRRTRPRPRRKAPARSRARCTRPMKTGGGPPNGSRPRSAPSPPISASARRTNGRRWSTPSLSGPATRMRSARRSATSSTCRSTRRRPCIGAGCRRSTTTTLFRMERRRLPTSSMRRGRSPAVSSIRASCRANSAASCRPSSLPASGSSAAKATCGGGTAIPPMPTPRRPRRNGWRPATGCRP